MVESDLEQLLDDLRIKYSESRIDGGVTYAILTRPGIDLQLDLDLYIDQLNINFNGCFVMLEQLAFEWRFSRNPKAFEECRVYCLGSIRKIMTSDLRVETRSRLDGSVLGGFLYRWDGHKWESCGGGGSMLLFLGVKKVSEYRSWQAEEKSMDPRQPTEQS